MKNRNPSNIEVVKQFVSKLNERFLRDDVPFYDIQARKYSVGTFYLHETMGKNGYEYEVREVLDENGGFKTLNPSGNNTIEGVMYFLDGYLSGHFATCDMLGYTLEVTEDDGDESDPFSMTDEEKEEADKKDDLAVETAKVLGTYEYEDDEEEGDTDEDVPEDADKDGKAEG
jgi:hypothetical protein